MPNERPYIDRNTLIPVGAVLFVASVAVSWGMLLGRVINLEERTDKLEEQVTQLSNYSDRITTLEVQNSQILSILAELKSDIKALQR